MTPVNLAKALSPPPLRRAFPRGQGDPVMYGDLVAVVSRGPRGAARVTVTGHPQAGTRRSQPRQGAGAAAVLLQLGPWAPFSLLGPTPGVAASLVLLV